MPFWTRLQLSGTHRPAERQAPSALRDPQFLQNHVDLTLESNAGAGYGIIGHLGSGVHPCPIQAGNAQSSNSAMRAPRPVTCVCRAVTILTRPLPALAASPACRWRVHSPRRCCRDRKCCSPCCSNRLPASDTCCLNRSPPDWRCWPTLLVMSSDKVCACCSTFCNSWVTWSGGTHFALHESFYRWLLSLLSITCSDCWRVCSRTLCAQILAQPNPKLLLYFGRNMGQGYIKLAAS